MRTRIATLAAAVVLAGTGLVATGGAAQAASSPGVPECGNADVQASYHARDAGAGHRHGVVRLRNTSGSTCTVTGYGGISYVGGGDGTQVGAAADRDAGRVRTVVLAPGRSAVSRVDETVAQDYPRATCRPVPVDGFRVYVPDSRTSQFVPHATTGCANPAVHLISHQPYRRG